MKFILTTLTILLIVSIAWAEAGTAVKARPILGKFKAPSVINNPKVGAAGGLLWKAALDGGCYYSCPTYDGKVVYTGTYDGDSFYAINASDGSKKWSVSGLYDIWSKPAVDSGTVFFAAASYNTFYALNTSDGSTKWKYTTSVYYPVASPAVLGDYVYFADLNGALFKLNKTTGALGWRQVVGSYGIGITRPVFNGDSLVIINTYNYTIVASRVSTGAAKWSLNTGSESEGKGVCIGNVVYFSGNAGMFALNALTGAQIWKFTFGDFNWGGCNYWNNMMFAGDYSNACYGVNATNGAQIWKFTTGGGVVFFPDIADNITSIW